MKHVVDQLNRSITLADEPKRIVSLVPSQTELLYDMGLSKRIVGLTRYCCHPENKPDHVKCVGGTKALEIAMIESLSPDLIVVNKEENKQNDIALLEAHYPVWVSDVNNFDEATQMIAELGKVLNVEERSKSLLREIESAFANLKSLSKPVKVAYLIWRKPYMVAAAATFIDDMLRCCGFENVYGHLTRYPEITLESLKDAQPEYVFLSSEPYPFSDEHIAAFESVVPKSNVVLVDGEYFSWFGSRLRYAPDYFKSLTALFSHENL